MEEHSFRTHINWAAYVDVFEGLIIFYRESKVSDFGFSFVVNKNIGQLEISMDDSFLIQIDQSFINFIDEGLNFLFLEFLLLEKNFFQISLPVVVSDDVAVVLA